VTTTNVTTLSFLDMAQMVADEIGISRPTAMTGTDPATRQIAALINREGRAQMKGFAWSALQFVTTITTVADQAAYAVPTDFDRYLPDTQWDRTNVWQIAGPDTPQMDRYRRESLVGNTTPRRIFRQVGYGVVSGRVGGKISIFPTPTVDGDTLAYEYISQCWGVDSTGATPKAALTADADLPVLDPQILVLGAKWRWLSAKGLDAEVAKMDFDQYVTSCKAQDNGMADISLGEYALPPLIGLGNIADGSWNLT
jgi:hypothetical protein